MATLISECTFCFLDQWLIQCSCEEKLDSINALSCGHEDRFKNTLRQRQKQIYTSSSCSLYWHPCWCGMAGLSSRVREGKGHSVGDWCFDGTVVQESDGWVVCRVFRKTKNFKTSKSQDDTSCSFEEDQHQQQRQLQQLPELLSPPVSKLIFNGNSHELQQHPSYNFQCKQELSIDDYGTHDTSTFLATQQQDQQAQLQIHHHLQHQVDHMAHHLAPCSSSTFRELCNRFEPPTNNIDDARSSEAAGSCSPFPDQSAYWMQLSEGAKTVGTRRDQTLADITCHVGRMKRQATDQSNLVHLWNV